MKYILMKLKYIDYNKYIHLNKSYNFIYYNYRATCEWCTLLNFFNRQSCRM